MGMTDSSYAMTQAEEIKEKIAVIQEHLRVFELELHQFGLGYNFSVMAVKRQLIIAALERNRWNQCKAAADLGMHRNNIHRLMEVLRISKPTVRKLPTRAKDMTLRALDRFRPERSNQCQR